MLSTGELSVMGHVDSKGNYLFACMKLTPGDIHKLVMDYVYLL